METINEGWTQTDFNRYVAQNDEVLTYKEIQEEAQEHNLVAEEAIMFAALFPGGEGL